MKKLFSKKSTLIAIGVLLVVIIVAVVAFLVTNSSPKSNTPRPNDPVVTDPKDENPGSSEGPKSSFKESKVYTFTVTGEDGTQADVKLTIWKPGGDNKPQIHPFDGSEIKAVDRSKSAWVVPYSIEVTRISGNADIFAGISIEYPNQEANAYASDSSKEQLVYVLPARVPMVADRTSNDTLVRVGYLEVRTQLVYGWSVSTTTDKAKSNDIGDTVVFRLAGGPVSVLSGNQPYRAFVFSQGYEDGTQMTEVSYKDQGVTSSKTISEVLANYTIWR